MVRTLTDFIEYILMFYDKDNVYKKNIPIISDKGEKVIAEKYVKNNPDKDINHSDNTTTYHRREGINLNVEYISLKDFLYKFEKNKLEAVDYICPYWYKYKEDGNK